MASRQRELMLAELTRVQVAAGWLEHAVSTGDTTITRAVRQISVLA